ncbi:MAG: hypothetical protein HY906_18535 [Deltaproteobacteria bacterium]|nr:hypothetical protein [Deltaproteobacteria bacterium]
MAETLDCVLLLALPASGKSEVRKYLERLSPEEARRDFHLGPTVQLDDYPYVHLMRRTDDELAALGQPRLFFHAPDRPFQDTRDWGTLIWLLNEDYDDLLCRRPCHGPAAPWLLDRFDAAAAHAGLPARLGRIDAAFRAALGDKLEQEAQGLMRDKVAGYPDTLAGKTLVVEFARGGPQGAPFPLKPCYGYRYSLGQLHPGLLEKATILYIWVTPEESRRKNFERADPNQAGSILHLGVPIEVMLGDYGCDDIDWLEQQSGRPGTVTVEASGRTFQVPLARFDNRVDKTSFIRQDAKEWTPAEIAAVHDGLQGALTHLAAARAAR